MQKWKKCQLFVKKSPSANLMTIVKALLKYYGKSNYPQKK